MKRKLEESEDMKHYFDHYHSTNALYVRADEPTLPNSITVTKETNKSSTWISAACILMSTDPKPHSPGMPRSLPKTLTMFPITLV